MLPRSIQRDRLRLRQRKEIDSESFTAFIRIYHIVSKRSSYFQTKVFLLSDKSRQLKLLPVIPIVWFVSLILARKGEKYELTLRKQGLHILQLSFISETWELNDMFCLLVTLHNKRPQSNMQFYFGTAQTLIYKRWPACWLWPVWSCWILAAT